MAVKEKIKSHPDVVHCFKELLFYNINIKKPRNKRLKSTDLLSELPFHEELNVIKTEAATRVFYKKSIARNFAKFTGKHLCQRLFFSKVY